MACLAVAHVLVSGILRYSFRDFHCQDYCRHSSYHPALEPKLHAACLQVSIPGERAVADDDLCRIVHDHFHLDTEQLQQDLSSPGNATQKANTPPHQARYVIS